VSRIVINPQDGVAESLAHDAAIAPRDLIAAAHEASKHGDWDHVAALIERIAPTSRQQRIEVAYLTARAALHAELPERARRALDDVADLVAPGERATEAILRGAALVTLGRDEAGTALLQQVAEGAAGPERTQAIYELAQAHWRAGRLDHAEAVLAPLVDADRAEGCELSVAHALELYGRIELERRRRPVAARHFLDALEMLGRFPATYGPLRASLVRGLVVIAVETLDLRLMARVQRELEIIPWPPGSPASSAAVRRLCLVGELLGGNESTAWALAFKELRTASAGSRYVAALLDAALVSRAVGEQFTPDRLTLMAADVASEVDWNASDDRTLLAVVRETAPVDAAAAGELLARCKPIQASTDRSGNDELHALACFARAAVAGAEGRRADQVTGLRSALALSREAGNHYAEIAALVALLEADPDEGLLRRADDLTRLVPRSWLHRRYETLAEHIDGPAKLSPAERRVMSAICEGLSTAQIADRFSRSKNTIRNQTRRVFTIMNVSSRSALVHKCASMDRARH
jgi:DNA-binding CsgD family transcriptional regulator